jgi:flagellar basal body-associated protein FliL
MTMPDPTYNQAAPQPAGAPPQKSGSSALKIVLIIVGIFVVIGMLFVGVIGYGVWRVSRAVHKSSNGQVTINTPGGGSISANENQQFTENDLGIAIYPGAQQQKDSLRMTFGGKTTVTANYLTPDSKDQVVAFYKDKAGPNAQSMITNDSAEFMVDVSGGDQATVIINQNAKSHNGETQITIVRAPKS